MPKLVHVVSHGPHCLDGTVAAVAVARYHEGAEVQPRFASNSEIDEALRAIAPTGRDTELWITDISWRQPETDAHLRSLAASGVHIFWIDHHRTALERVRAGKVDVPFTDSVLSEEYAASRLTYEYLAGRLRAEGRRLPRFDALDRLVAMADDNDRWLHRIPGSRELAWTVRALDADAYGELMATDGAVTYTPRMREALARSQAEIEASFATARASRVERRVGGVNLIVAVCDGHPSEIADAWGKESQNAVFALYDAKSLAVSLRRSPDCTVDLSHVAASLGGGGHAAAAGCQLPELRRVLAEAVADRVGEKLP